MGALFFALVGTNTFELGFALLLGCNGLFVAGFRMFSVLFLLHVCDSRDLISGCFVICSLSRFDMIS